MAQKIQAFSVRLLTVLCSVLERIDVALSRASYTLPFSPLENEDGEADWEDRLNQGMQSRGRQLRADPYAWLRQDPSCCTAGQVLGAHQVHMAQLKTRASAPITLPAAFSPWIVGRGWMQKPSVQVGQRTTEVRAIYNCLRWSVHAVHHEGSNVRMSSQKDPRRPIR
jgi:hypothetical protein